MRLDRCGLLMTVPPLDLLFSCCIGGKPYSLLFPSTGTKTTLLVKPDYLDEASHLFKDTDIKIVTDGACVLGAPINSDSFVHSWFKDKVQSWVEELNTPK